MRIGVDPGSLAAAAVTAAAALLFGGWPWPRPAAQVSAGWVLGVGLGFLLGCWFSAGGRTGRPGRSNRLLLLVWRLSSASNSWRRCPHCPDGWPGCCG